MHQNWRSWFIILFPHETCNDHWVGLREHLQETPIFNGKNPWFPVDFPLNQSNEMSRSFLHFQLEKPIKFRIQSILRKKLRASERPMCGEGKSSGSEPIPQMDYG